jgi:hypothetical protein
LSDGESVVLSNQIGERGRTRSDSQPFGLIRIFGGIGNPVKPTENLPTRAALIRRPRIREHLWIENRDCVQSDSMSVIKANSIEIRRD